MKRKEFFQLIQPLIPKLYRFAYVFLPDDLQSEQLLIDVFNAYLLKERKGLLRKEIDFSHKKDVQLARRNVFKGILRCMSDIGQRRSLQMMEQMKLTRPLEFKTFYELEPKLRMILTLRYDFHFTVEEIEELVQMARYEVIEKLHNGRFLILNGLNKGVVLG